MYGETFYGRHTAQPQLPYHIPYSMPAKPNHIPCHAHNAIPYTIPCTSGMPYTVSCPPGHTIYHAVHCQAMPYTMLYIARPCPIPSNACHAIPHAMPCPPGHTNFHAMPAKLYHIPCHARQALPYTMSCPSDHTTCHAMPARPYHILFHASQDILCTMPCLARP